MALTSDQIIASWKQTVADVTALYGSVLNNLDKATLAAAVSAADTWTDANATSFVNALPAAFKTYVANNVPSANRAQVYALVLTNTLMRKYLG